MLRDGRNWGVAGIMIRKMDDFDDAFFGSVRAILAEARRKAAASINFVMVEAYWRIGERIVEEEQNGQARAGYGQELIKEL